MNSSNRITNSGFTYNASGDMTADGTLTFTWNAEERLTAAGGVTYTYDGDGWRVKKSNGIIHWRSLSGEILAETDLAGNNLREYIYFAGRRVARRDANGTVYYFLQDHLGSTRIIANASGGVVRDVDYYPHGTEKLVSGTVDDPHKFAGMYFDSESGLYYTWFRMYSPSLGRWLAPDPIAGDVATPGSLNRYTYVLNNPVNLVDPLGLFWAPPFEPPTPPSGPPGPDPFGPPSPNPFGNGEGCTAPDGQCGGRPGSGGGTGGNGETSPFGEAVKQAALKELDLDQMCRDFVNSVLQSLVKMGALKDEFATIANLKSALSAAPIYYGGKPPRPNVGAEADLFKITTFEPFIEIGTNRIAALIHEAFHLGRAGGITDVGLAKAANVPFKVGRRPEDTAANASEAFTSELQKHCGPK